MADGVGTRLNQMEESIAGFREILTQQGRQIAQNIQQLQVLTDSLIVFMKRFTDIDAKLDQLTENMKALESASPSDSSDKGKNVGSEPVIGRSPFDVGIKKPKNFARPPRLDFPRFDGADPLGWIFKAEQFFNYYQTPEEHKLTLASFYMDGDALAWFQLAHKNTGLVDWDDFTQALTDRFGPSNVEDQHESLPKSAQTSSLAEHQSSRSICTAECSSGEGCHFFHRPPGGYNAIAQMSNQENPAAHPASRNSFASSPISDGRTATKTCLCNKFNTLCKFGENCNFNHHDERELDRPFFSGHETPMAPPMGGRNGTWQEPQAPPSQGALATFGASATAKISVDAWLAGPIIGKGGVNTKQVYRTTGAKIYIRDHESDSNLKNIELEGTFDQIKHATGMVEELIANISSGMHAPAKPSVGVEYGGGCLGYGFSSGHTPAAGRNSFKTRICDKFSKGACSYGDRCNFAHGVEELRKFGAA